MARSVDIVLRFLGDSKGAEAAAKRAGGSASNLSKGIAKAQKPALAVTAAVAGIAGAAVAAASRTQQAFGGLDSVFGKSSAVVKGWANSAASSAGLSAAAYAEMAAKIGSQLKSAGVPLDKIAGQTRTLIRQGADLSATFGGSAASAVDALSAALRGEADPAERLGLSLSQTRVNALLAARGQSKLTGTALSTAKAAAIQSLITQQAAGSLGQFARESDTAAGASQIAQARFQNAASTLGTVLLPAAASVMEVFGRFATVLGQHATTTRIVATVVGTLAAALLIANAAMAAHATITAVVTGVQDFLAGSTAATAVQVYALIAAEKVAAVATQVWAGVQSVLNAVMDANPLSLIIIGVIALVAAIILAYRNSATFRAIVQAALAAVLAAARAVAAGFAAAWGAVWPVMQAGARAIGSAFSAVMGVARTVGSAIASAFDGPRAVIDTIIGAVQRLIEWIAKIKIPHISLPFGIGGGGGSAGMLMGVSGPALIARDTAGLSPIPGGPSRVGFVGSGQGLSITVTGALDPDAVARQIESLLARRARRLRGVRT